MMSEESSSKQMQSAQYDPRSPSREISRTPLGLGNNVSKQQFIDPRSPSCSITRTPILLAESSVQTSAQNTSSVKMTLNYENLPPHETEK